MSSKGSNGILDGQRNVEVFLSWVATTADFKPFIYQGLLSISKVACECGLRRDVFYTNPGIRDNHWPALIKQLEDAGVLKARTAKPVDSLQRLPRRDVVNDARIKQIQEENEAVKAENRELRRQLEKLKFLDEMLHATGRIPW